MGSEFDMFIFSLLIDDEEDDQGEQGEEVKTGKGHGQDEPTI
jgi:hypothetical protein